MAKGARSNSKKAVRAQRRLNLKANWQDEADTRRYAALAQAAAAESIPITVHVSDVANPVEEVRARQKKDAMQTDAGEPKAAEAAGKAKGKKRKGVNVKGIQKRHNSKKMSALWASEFHKKKSGKQGLQ